MNFTAERSSADLESAKLLLSLSGHPGTLRNDYPFNVGDYTNSSTRRQPSMPNDLGKKEYGAFL